MPLPLMTRQNPRRHLWPQLVMSRRTMVTWRSVMWSRRIAVITKMGRGAFLWYACRTCVPLYMLSTSFLFRYLATSTALRKVLSRLWYFTTLLKAKLHSCRPRLFTLRDDAKQINEFKWLACSFFHGYELVRRFFKVVQSSTTFPSFFSF